MMAVLYSFYCLHETVHPLINSLGYPGGATLEQVAADKRYLMKVPTDENGLTHNRFTRQWKENILFDADDAGMTVYVCYRYENRRGERRANGGL
jgi:hypothetical protein